VIKLCCLSARSKEKHKEGTAGDLESEALFLYAPLDQNDGRTDEYILNELFQYLREI